MSRRMEGVRYGWAIVVVTALCGALLAAGVTFLQPMAYSSTTRILITQELGVTDPYSAARSTAIVAQQLSDILPTTEFYEKVMGGGFAIEESYFPADSNDRWEKWQETLATSLSQGSNLLAVTAYHPDVAQAEALARAAATVLTQDGWMYTGSPISLRIVDDPLNSRMPVRPNVFMNVLSGLLLGALAGVAYIIIFTERARRTHVVRN